MIGLLIGSFFIAGLIAALVLAIYTSSLASSAQQKDDEFYEAYRKHSKRFDSYAIWYGTIVGVLCCIAVIILYKYIM